MFKNKYTIGIIAFIVVLVLGMSAKSVFASKSPDQLRLEAAMARIEAMRSDCKTISKRVKDCFTDDDKSSCVQMQESYAWFTSEYKESPDFACSTVPDVFQFGAVKK